jgi:hypothetical protein
MKKLFIILLISSLFIAHLECMDQQKTATSKLPIPKPKPIPIPINKKTQRSVVLPPESFPSSSSLDREWPPELKYSTELGSSTDFTTTSPNQTPLPTPVTSPRGELEPEKKTSCCTTCLRRLFCCFCCWCCAKKEYISILDAEYDIVVEK